VNFRGFFRRRPESHKHASELAYWRDQLARQGDLEQSASLYARCFQDIFDVPYEFYAGKRLLDVGCGPRGSLVWAENAAERVGLDPLAHDYRRLQTQSHAMAYVQGGAERIPFGDGYFDVVSSINSIDHVDDLDAAVGEITRVTRAGGMLLLLVDVNHEPTPTEPHRLTWDFPDRFEGFDVVDRRDYERHGDNMYDNIFFVGKPYSHDQANGEPGVLAARLERRSDGGLGRGASQVPDELTEQRALGDQRRD
jgi:SAM-dependent methyltransferase